MLEWGNRRFFLYVGTDKAASTWIHDVLESHPECFVPELKDLYYFDRYYHRGEAWYRSWFEGLEERHLALGEFSHDYLYSPLACIRIKRDAPESRIIVSVREPVSRAFSNYLFLVRHGLTRLPFARALDRFPELIEHSLYGEAVARYLRAFGRERVLVVVFDDIQADPAAVALRLCGFLGLRQAVDLDRVGSKRLPAAAPRSVGLAAAAKAVAVGLRRVGLESVLGRLKASPGVQRVLYREYASYPELDPLVRASLGTVFEDDIRDLEHTLDIDLSRWRAPPRL